MYETVISFTLNIDIANLTIQLKNNIRNETSKQMNIDISRIGLLDIAESVNKMRRLMSIQVSYTITSTELSETKTIESSISLEKLNSILSTASNNTLLATDIQIKTIIISEEIPDVTLTIVTKDATIMIVVICVAVAVTAIVGILSIYFRKRLPVTKLKGGEFNILDDSHEYCPVCSYAIENP